MAYLEKENKSYELPEPGVDPLAMADLIRSMNGSWQPLDCQEHIGFDEALRWYQFASQVERSFELMGLLAETGKIPYEPEVVGSFAYARKMLGRDFHNKYDFAAACRAFGSLVGAAEKQPEDEFEAIKIVGKIEDQLLARRQS